MNHELSLPSIMYRPEQGFRCFKRWAYLRPNSIIGIRKMMGEGILTQAFEKSERVELEAYEINCRFDP